LEKYCRKVYNGETAAFRGPKPGWSSESGTLAVSIVWRFLFTGLTLAAGPWPTLRKPLQTLNVAVRQKSKIASFLHGWT